MSILHAVDTVVICRLDRLDRPYKDLNERLEAAKVRLGSLQENIDTTSSGGKVVFHLLETLAEFEHDVIRARIQAELVVARAAAQEDGRRALIRSSQDRFMLVRILC